MNNSSTKMVETVDFSNASDQLCADCDENGFMYCQTCQAWYCATHGGDHEKMCSICGKTFCFTQELIAKQLTCNDCLDIEILEAELDSAKKTLAKIKGEINTDPIDNVMKKIEEFLENITIDDI